jgi:hypothetical protein
MRRTFPVVARMMAIGALIAIMTTSSAQAWEQEGHKVTALIAYRFLQPEVRKRIDDMLSQDSDTLTAHDFASVAVWADLYRDSDQSTTGERYSGTEKWHYIPVQITHPNIDAACFGRPKLPPGTLASRGSGNDCILDKIKQFEVELGDAHASEPERLLALKYLIHLLGDLHQPLHIGEDHDEGGGLVKVSAEGFAAGSLHHFWDREFVHAINPDPDLLAAALISGITPIQMREWQSGTVEDWVDQSFALSRDSAYAPLVHARKPGNVTQLDSNYVRHAEEVVAAQLCKGGLRLAVVLNRALREEHVP